MVKDYENNVIKKDSILYRKSILEEAENIVNGTRKTDYGGIESFSKCAEICKQLGINISAKDITIIMIALKLVRESYKHKRDNMVDVCGYASKYMDVVEDYL